MNAIEISKDEVVKTLSSKYTKESINRFLINYYKKAKYHTMNSLNAFIAAHGNGLEVIDSVNDDLEEDIIYPKEMHELVPDYGDQLVVNELKRTYSLRAKDIKLILEQKDGVISLCKLCMVNYKTYKKKLVKEDNKLNEDIERLL